MQRAEAECAQRGAQTFGGYLGINSRAFLLVRLPPLEFLHQSRTVVQLEVLYDETTSEPVQNELRIKFLSRTLQGWIRRLCLLEPINYVMLCLPSMVVSY